MEDILLQELSKLIEKFPDAEFKMEYFDKDGALKFTEEYIYNEYGDLIGYSYYDKDGKFAAKYISSGEDEGFYYQDGKAMSEEEFSVRMEAIGAMG